LYAQDIMAALVGSYSETDDLLKFNLPIALDALNRTYGMDLAE